MSSPIAVANDQTIVHKASDVKMPTARNSKRSATVTNLNRNPPPTVTTTMTAFPVSPIPAPKWVTDESSKSETSNPQFSTSMPRLRETTSPSIPVVVDEDIGSSGSVGHQSSSSSSSYTVGPNVNGGSNGSDKTMESALPLNVVNRSFSPTNGIDTLILAATDGMRDDDSMANTTLLSTEDHDNRSVSSNGSGGRKLRTWHESFQALVQYKERHGNTNVPVRYLEDSALANWVRYQQRNQESLPNEKRQRLKCIGFQFGARNDRQWDAKLQRLQEYQQEYGRHATVRDLELSQWVSTQRSLYKKNLLRADRQEKLDAIGFVWQANQKHVDPQNLKSGPSQTRRDAQWNAQFEKLQEFYKAHGHFRVPNQYEKDPSLGIWVSNQRSIHNRGQLPCGRKALLDSIGFVWRVEAKDARASLYQKQWEQQLEGLIQYNLLHGNCDVPANFEKRGLGVWVVVQKEAGRKGSLDPLRAEKLLSTGLSWGDERDTCWTKSFVKLQSYLVGKKVGTEVSFEEVTSYDAKLGNWIKLQCVVKKHNKLFLKRAFLLENIGCQWNDAKMIVMSDVATQLIPPQPPVVKPQQSQQQIPETKATVDHFVPDMACSAPQATKQKASTILKRVVSTSSRSPTMAVARPSSSSSSKSTTIALRCPATAAAVKRQVCVLHMRRGRDPPGDPPGKRVRLTLLPEQSVPMMVRSDPPGDAPSSCVL